MFLTSMLTLVFIILVHLGYIISLLCGEPVGMTSSEGVVVFLRCQAT